MSGESPLSATFVMQESPSYRLVHLARSCTPTTTSSREYRLFLPKRFEIGASITPSYRKSHRQRPESLHGIGFDHETFCSRGAGFKQPGT